MNELIPVHHSGESVAVSARELHEFLEVGTDFRHWFSRQLDFGFSESMDFERVVQKCPTPGGMQDVVDYALSIDMAKELCMIQHTQRGKQARQYFLAVEKDWNSPEKVMARALKMADRTLNTLQAQIEQDKPKVLLAEAVAESEGCILISELAKLLKQNGVDTGEKRLFQWMRLNGYLCSRGDNYNLPTQRAMDMKLFRIVKTPVRHTSGYTTMSHTPKVTGKGQVYFINLFLKSKEEKA